MSVWWRLRKSLLFFPIPCSSLLISGREWFTSGPGFLKLSDLLDLILLLFLCSRVFFNTETRVLEDAEWPPKSDVLDSPNDYRWRNICSSLFTASNWVSFLSIIIWSNARIIGVIIIEAAGRLFVHRTANQEQEVYQHLGCSVDLFSCGAVWKFHSYHNSYAVVIVIYACVTNGFGNNISDIPTSIRRNFAN